jgi:hypothetical protein
MVADADVPDISDEVAALSIVEPTEFTAARNARAKELRAAKERDRAALVAKLAKPSWTAWSLNVLARQDPDAIASWLAAGEALEAALGGGDREALRDAQRDERSSLASTIDQASAVLAAAGRKVDDQVAPKLTGTLRAAITDPDVRERLTRGVLVDDVEAAAVGFGFGFGFGFGADDASGGAEVVGLDELRARRAAKKAPRSKASTAKATSPTKRTTPTDDGVDDEAEAAAEEARRAEEAAMAARAQALAKAEAKRVAAERARLERELRALERQHATRSEDAEASAAAAIAAREAADAAAAALRSTEDALAETRRALDALPPPP